jgi:excisionase family DNA binding protein
MRYLTVQEAADLLRVSPKTIYEQVAQKKIPHIKIGTRIRIDLQRLEAKTR